jgi:hypothetical protein
VTHYNGAPTVQASLLDHEKAHTLDREVITTVSDHRHAGVVRPAHRTGLRPIHRLRSHGALRGPT